MNLAGSRHHHTYVRIARFLFVIATASLKSRATLQLEVAAFRHQLALYRSVGKHPRITEPDRFLWAFIASFCIEWKRLVHFVRPRTIVSWQRKRFRRHWRAMSRPRRPGRPRISPELRTLSKRMWLANPTWGSPRIVGIEVSKFTVKRYRPAQPRPGSGTWKTFLDQHMGDFVAVDIFTVPTVS